MKHAIIFFFFAVIAPRFVVAQITPGQYFQVLDEGEDEDFINFKFSASGALDIKSGGKYAKMESNLSMYADYKTKEKGGVNTIDIFFHSKKTNEIYRTIPGLYRKKDANNLELMISFYGDRPKTIDENNSGYLLLTLNTPENYVYLLQLYEKQRISGFKPDIKETAVDAKTKKIAYFANGAPVQSEAFQSYELVESDAQGRLIKKSLFNHEDKPFVNQAGFHAYIVNYNAAGKKESVEYRDAKGDFIVYNKALFPQVKYTYQNNKVSQLERLVNNDSLKSKTVSIRKFTYDSYGDETAVEEFFADGTPRINKAQPLVLDSLKTWILRQAQYPESFKLELVGSVDSLPVWEGGKLQTDKNSYSLYVEFTMNDSLQKPTKFTGSFRLDPTFKVTGVRYKTKKWDTEEFDFPTWSRSDLNKWQATFGHPLTEAERLAQEEQERKENEESEKMLRLLFSGKGKNNLTISTSGSGMDKDSKKEMKKLAKTLKKMLKSSK